MQSDERGKYRNESIYFHHGILAMYQNFNSVITVLLAAELSLCSHGLHALNVFGRHGRSFFLSDFTC